MKQKFILISVLTSFWVGLESFAHSSSDQGCVGKFEQLLRSALVSTRPNQQLAELKSFFARTDLGGKILAEMLERYDVNDVAKTYVKWIAEREAKVNYANARDYFSEPQLPIDFKETQICIHFWDKDANAIFQAKEMKNLHQTGTSSGFSNKSERVWEEDLLAGLKLGTSEQALRLRPKSGFLNIPKQQKTGWVQGSVSKTYGNMAAVLTPEMKERSVWVIGDSQALVYNGGLRHKAPSKMEAYVLYHRGTFERPQLTGAGANFIETLTYGNVGLNDIDHFIVYDAAQAQSLKKFKKPIFLVKEVIENNHTSLEYVSMVTQGEFKTLPQSLPKEAQSKFKKYFLND